MYELIKVKELETLGNVALYIRSVRDSFVPGEARKRGGGFPFSFRKRIFETSLKKFPGRKIQSLFAKYNFQRRISQGLKREESGTNLGLSIEDLQVHLRNPRDFKHTSTIYLAFKHASFLPSCLFSSSTHTLLAKIL